MRSGVENIPRVCESFLSDPSLREECILLRQGQFSSHLLAYPGCQLNEEVGYNLSSTTEYILVDTIYDYTKSD